MKLHGRPHIRMLNSISIPLPIDDSDEEESPMMSHSECTMEESSTMSDSDCTTRESPLMTNSKDTVAESPIRSSSETTRGVINDSTLMTR